ncbi:hypothetical protein DMS23_15635 [Klebsiella variicola]|nr:hypothetical protein DMS23_15635 [Klebsiella variicola]
MEPRIAKEIVSAMTDRRSLWATFDAEYPDHVRQSLDELRRRFTSIQGNLLDGTALDKILVSLIKTILIFFDAMKAVDLRTLRYSSDNPEWYHFNDALSALRKSIGMQIANLANAYGIALCEDLQSIAPTRI